MSQLFLSVLLMTAEMVGVEGIYPFVILSPKSILLMLSIVLGDQTRSKMDGRAVKDPHTAATSTHKETQIHKAARSLTPSRFTWI